jgi:hypothetical protein
MFMSTKELIFKEIEQISESYWDEVLSLIQTIKKITQVRKEKEENLGGLGGLWKGVEFSEEDIAEARKEMWGSLGERKL